MKLHHIGIVVGNIKQSIGELKNYLNFETTSTIMPVGSQKVNICLLKIGDPFLELIEPASPDSAISEFARSGGGIHHLCFEVKDIEVELESFAKKGATILVNPVRGFDERRIAFVDLNTKNTKCGLVELLEMR
ncbi:VOC family protein [Candidatus Nitrosotalea okcheonensis]|uniref:VOC family protein n=1 Tax=Candidatus Nitrosotalea okcheonensis TaxID=1903276 RepID=UPI0012FFE01B|nr:VOC family protein [Candidatus Nitrosotalea okcheonensis]MDE1831676.1 VOC family protein [Nitrososphaerota archaeon]MDE1840566.1 VOC family protein [Nitrososphaerota archaeon]MDE1877230.1 VOC family protein [Nitrososphaerota archaeon]